MALIPFLIVIPLAGAFLIALGGRRAENVSGFAAVLAMAGAAFTAVRVAMAASGRGALVYAVGNWQPPVGIPLVADSLSSLLLVITNVIAFLIAVYSTAYLVRYTDRWKYYALFLIAIAGANGLLLAGDLFTLFVFLEVASIAIYALVAYGTEKESLEAAFKYTVMSSVASAFILLGIAFIYSYTSTLTFSEIARTLALQPPTRVVPFVTVLFLMGFGFKCALVPFHGWLPDAHSSAPAPVSAMLSGVLIKVLGVYALARVFYNIIGVNEAFADVLVVLACVSMVVGSLLAFGQTSIKRLFAYSTISQIGYIVLGLALCTPLGALGAVFHLCNHSVAKSLLFMNAGAIEAATGSKNLKKMSAVAADMPVTGYTGLVGALSISGVPPFGGFWSKLVIIFACIQSGRTAAGAIAIAASAMTLAYYFRALTPVYFGPRAAPEGPVPTRPARGTALAMGLPMVALALAAIAGGLMLLPGPVNNALKAAAAVIVSGAGVIR